MESLRWSFQYFPQILHLQPPGVMSTSPVKTLQQSPPFSESRGSPGGCMRSKVLSEVERSGPSTGLWTEWRIRKLISQAHGWGLTKWSRAPHGSQGQLMIVVGNLSMPGRFVCSKSLLHLAKHPVERGIGLSTSICRKWRLLCTFWVVPNDKGMATFCCIIFNA